MRISPGAVRMPPDRQEQRHGLLGGRGGLDDLEEGGFVLPDRRVAGTVAPARRVPVGQPRHLHRPSSVGVGRVARKDQLSIAANSALRIFEDLTLAATVSG